MKKLLVVLLVLGLAAPAMAQTQTSLYGSLRVHTGYSNVSDNFIGGPGIDDTIGNIGQRDEGVLHNISQSTRAGIRAKMSDSTSAVLEFGVRTNDGAATNVGTRLFYGTYNFGMGSLSVGQQHPVATFLGYSNMYGTPVGGGDGNMLGMGLPYAGRNPMIRLDMAGASLALVTNSGTNAVAQGLGYNEADRWLPRVEAAYVFRTPMIAVRPILAYQTFTINDLAPGGDDRTVESWLAGLGVSMTFGPAYVKLSGTWSQNPANMAMNNVLAGPANTGRANQFDDSEVIWATGVVGFNFSPTFFVEAGVGYNNAKVDTAPGVEEKSDGYVFYVQAPFVFAPGFQLIPEIGQLSRGDSKRTNLADQAQGRATYASAIFKIDF
jgi:hypothetical protein